MTNLYNKYILPKVTNVLCASNPNMKQREKVVPLAKGRVLEIGVGTGLNFKYYEPREVRELMALDPSEEMWTLAKKRVDDLSFPVHYVKGLAEKIPLDRNSIDTIVITYTYVPSPITQLPSGSLSGCSPQKVLLFLPNTERHPINRCRDGKRH